MKTKYTSLWVRSTLQLCTEDPEMMLPLSSPLCSTINWPTRRFCNPQLQRALEGTPYFCVLSLKSWKTVSALPLLQHLQYVSNREKPLKQTWTTGFHLISLWAESKCQREFGVGTLYLRRCITNLHLSAVPTGSTLLRHWLTLDRCTRIPRLLKAPIDLCLPMFGVRNPPLEFVSLAVNSL